MVIDLGYMLIQPQSSAYHFWGAEPRKIGDMASIVISSCNFRVASRAVNVILLADASGRQWLVEVPR